MFCCSSCPFVFCNKCIRSNLSNSYVKEIEETDDWSCFVCDKNVLKKHRAQHWALRNFMNKQLEKIQKANVHSEDELNNLLNEDVSVCCPRKKRKSILKPVAAPVKRPSMNGGILNLMPPAKKPNIQLPPQKVTRMGPTGRSSRSSSPRSLPSNPNSEIVCTPDILGLFNENDDAIPTSNMVPTAPPPPLVMRNNQRTHVVSRSASVVAPAPIYHNVNGFQIDLNHASRQDIFRLPNGKLIQVRKQTAPPTVAPTPFRVGNPNNPSPRGPQFTIRQASPVSSIAQTTTTRMYRPQLPLQTRIRFTPNAQPRFTTQPQQRFTFTDGRCVPTPIQPIPHIPAIQPTPPPPKPVVSGALASTVFTQQNGSISVARAPQPDTPFGASKTEFEDKIISGMEICQHTINKMITLTNSTSFKQSRSFTDLKDLYIHLQYLFTYTAGKFTTLQDSLKTGIESLVKHEVPKEKCDDDELEIVEQKADIIEVMSDDDEPPQPEKIEQLPGKKPLLKHIQYTSKDTPEVADATKSSVSAVSSGETATADESGSSIENPTADEIVAVICAPSPGLLGDENFKALFVETAEAIAKDKKLSNRVVVKVEKLENSKSPVIRQFMREMQERLAMQSSSESSREATPEVELDKTLENLEENETSPAANEATGSADVDIVDDKDEEKENSSKDSNAPEKSNEVENVVETEKKTDAEDIRNDFESILQASLADESNSSSFANEDVLKIDNEPPVELMEANDEIVVAESQKTEEMIVEDVKDPLEQAEKAEEPSPASPAEIESKLKDSVKCLDDVNEKMEIESNSNDGKNTEAAASDETHSEATVTKLQEKEVEEVTEPTENCVVESLPTIDDVLKTTQSNIKDMAEISDDLNDSVSFIDSSFSVTEPEIKILTALGGSQNAAELEIDDEKAMLNNFIDKLEESSNMDTD